MLSGVVDESSGSVELGTWESRTLAVDDSLPVNGGSGIGAVDEAPPCDALNSSGAIMSGCCFDPKRRNATPPILASKSAAPPAITKGMATDFLGVWRNFSGMTITTGSASGLVVRGTGGVTVVFCTSKSSSRRSNIASCSLHRLADDGYRFKDS